MEMLLALLLTLLLRPPEAIEVPVVEPADLRPEVDRLVATADRLVLLVEAVFVCGVFTAGLTAMTFLACGRGPKDRGRRPGDPTGERSDHAGPGRAGADAPAPAPDDPHRPGASRGVDLPPLPPSP